ncbi:hypothetical protein HK102_007862 [Quaeritorhiza haematococci]|nr:hypothetical protein HK102_007862 [Quaeritorhiza haematococci]
MLSANTPAQMEAAAQQQDQSLLQSKKMDLTVRDLYEVEFPSDDEEDADYHHDQVQEEAKEINDDAEEHSDEEDDEEDEEISTEEIHDIVVDSMAIQSAKSLRSRNVQTTNVYREATIMDEFASDDEEDEDYVEHADEDIEVDSEGEDEEFHEAEEVEVPHDEVSDIIAMADLDPEHPILLKKGKVLRDGTEIQGITDKMDQLMRDSTVASEA